MQTHAIALFADRHSAHAAVEQLVQAGFPRDSISLVLSEDTYEREFGAPPPDRSGVRITRSLGVLGAIVAGLVVFARPGNPSLRVGGPLVAALLRAGVLSRALAASGLEEREARTADARIRSGAIVVGVQAQRDLVQTAMQLLELSGGEALQAA